MRKTNSGEKATATWFPRTYKNREEFKGRSQAKREKAAQVEAKALRLRQSFKVLLGGIEDES